MSTSKYNAEKKIVDGITFASKKEAKRYIELKLLQKNGKITGLKLQPRFEIIPKQRGEQAAFYTADFLYAEGGNIIVEEVKSPYTAKKADYILRRKLFKLNYHEYVFREYI